MRSPEQAATAWHKIKSFFHKHKSLEVVRAAIRADQNAHPLTQDGVRSACWKAFLLFETIDTREWPKILTSSRSAYNAVREHYAREADFFVDGLPRNAPEAEELLAEIRKDVERCLPGNLYFQQPETQAMMIDILFVFCSLHPDLGYRQGMHELLAPIVWVVERDAIELGHSSKALGEEAVIRAVFDAEYIEHDSFALFCKVMQSAKGFYEQTTHSAADNPIVVRSRRVFDELLPLVDQELASHLTAIDVVPQIFLIRWIRLLFGRELSFDQLLLLWDVLFAIDPSLELVDYLCILMLLRLRWQLLDSDFQGALTMLLQSSQPDNTFDAARFALDAAYLRDHCDVYVSSHFVLKYTGTALHPINRPNTPPLPPRNVTVVSEQSFLDRSTPSPSRRPRQARNFEDMLQSIAGNIYSRGEKFGIARVVRNAVDEVHRKALEIRDAQGPGPTSGFDPRDKVSELEKRQLQLGQLLNGTVEELWSYQKHATDATHGTPTERDTALQIERLNAAIARVQFVQVYLQDSTLPLLESDIFSNDDNTRPQEEANHNARQAQDEVPEKRKQDSVGDDNPALESAPVSTNAAKVEKDSASAQEEKDRAESVTPQPPPTRPPLAESSFSWMLGQDKEDNSSLTGSTVSRISASRTAVAEDRQLFPSPAGDYAPPETPSPRVRAGRQRIKKQVVFSSPSTLADDPFTKADSKV